MTHEFKTELQKLIDKAAEKAANEHFPPIHPAFEGTENQIFDMGFSYGCEFLIPLIESLIKTRYNYLKYRETTYSDMNKIIENHDMALLNLLRGER